MIVTDKGLGTGDEGGVLKMKTAGCLLYILLLTTCMMYRTQSYKETK